MRQSTDGETQRSPEDGGSRAEILGVSQNTLRTLAGVDKIPVYRTPANGYRLFRKTDRGNFLWQVEASGTKPPQRKKR